MHGAAFVTGAAQKIANPKYALANAAYVEMAAAVTVRIDPSTFYLIEKMRVEFVGRGGHRFEVELRMGRSPLLDLAAIASPVRHQAVENQLIRGPVEIPAAIEKPFGHRELVTCITANMTRRTHPVSVSNTVAWKDLRR